MDEVIDCGNLEQPSVVIRFVDGDKQIREEFLGFITVERITADAFSSDLFSFEEHEIDITLCRRQGYDGTSSMSSSSVGAQGRITTFACSPCTYTDCQSHQLNLCIVKACSVPCIRNTKYWFCFLNSQVFNYSSKCQQFF